MKKIKGGYYIKARQIKDSWISKASPEIRDFWDYLIREATYHEQIKYKLTLRQGELLKSIEEIIDDLSWKVGFSIKKYTSEKIKSFLRILRREEMITSERFGKYTMIKVLNYHIYCDPENYEQILKIKHDSSLNHVNFARTPGQTPKKFTCRHREKFTQTPKFEAKPSSPQTPRKIYANTENRYTQTPGQTPSGSLLYSKKDVRKKDNNTHFDEKKKKLLFFLKSILKNIENDEELLTALFSDEKIVTQVASEYAEIQMGNKDLNEKKAYEIATKNGLMNGKYNRKDVIETIVTNLENEFERINRKNKIREILNVENEARDNEIWECLKIQIEGVRKYISDQNEVTKHYIKKVAIKKMKNEGLAINNLGVEIYSQQIVLDATDLLFYTDEPGYTINRDFKFGP